MKIFWTLGFLPFLAYANITGKVIGISDGDTLTVLDTNQVQHKVRLAGIDAPEKKQAFGQKSKESLSDCAYLKQVKIEGEKLDKYGRLIGKVIVNNQDCNLIQIAKGMAWHYKKYQKEQSSIDRLTYSNEEIKAKNNRLGLWNDMNAIPPWEFRH